MAWATFLYSLLLTLYYFVSLLVGGLAGVVGPGYGEHYRYHKG
jgi:hypothetical protein